MIVAVFKDNDDYARALGLTQWDYGQELRIQGLNLPTAVEIHFSLRETGGEAVTRVGITKDGITTVPIPDSMLEGEGVANDYHIYAWVYLSDTKSGETIKRITMPVKARSKPEPFDTPEASELFEQAIEAVNEAADRAEKAGAEAVKVGEEAKEAAAKAGEHLEAVQSLAGQVEINADAVAQDKQAVAGMVTQTQQAASEAALSAQAAKQSQTAAEQAQAGAEAAEDTARLYAAETEEDRQEVAEDKQAVSQMRDDVAADREAVENAVAGFDGAVQGAMGEIAGAGKTQVAAVNTAGQTAVQAVETAKGEVVKAVEAEGTEQAGIVATEGTKQLGEIKRVMATIPEDYTDLSELAESNYRNKAPGIVETASGALIEIRDASDLPVRGLTVYGRSEQKIAPGANILPLEVGQKGDGFEVFEDGVQVDVNRDADIYVVGNEFLYDTFPLLTPGKYYIYSGNQDVFLYVIAWRNGTSVTLGYSIGDSAKEIEVMVGDKFRIFLRTASAYKGKVKAMISKTKLNASSYAPYTGGNPSIENPQEINTAGEGGEIGLNLTGKNWAIINSFDVPNANKIAFLEAGEYTVSVDMGRIDDNTNFFGFNIILGESIGTNINLLNSGTIKEPGELSGTFMMKERGWVSFNGYTNASYKVMIVRGNKKAPYEPYKSQSLTRPTPNGLPGIPVTSGGNYTDQNGQQRMCDTVEHRDGAGEYVQRLKTVNAKDITWIKDSYNGIMRYTSLQPDIKRNGAIMSNRFVQGNYSDAPGKCSTDEAKLRCCFDTTFDTLDKVTRFFAENETVFVYELAEPIRTPLTPEQLAALKQLHTFHPTTIITNDAGVDLEVSYVADTKTYIDNQFAQLNKTILDAVIGGK